MGVPRGAVETHQAPDEGHCKVSELKAPIYRQHSAGFTPLCESGGGFARRSSLTFVMTMSETTVSAMTALVNMIAAPGMTVQPVTTT
jgi:hypothetical protein